MTSLVSLPLKPTAIMAELGVPFVVMSVLLVGVILTGLQLIKSLRVRAKLGDAWASLVNLVVSFGSVCAAARNVCAFRFDRNLWVSQPHSRGPTVEFGCVGIDRVLGYIAKFSPWTMIGGLAQLVKGTLRHLTNLEQARIVPLSGCRIYNLSPKAFMCMTLFAERCGTLRSNRELRDHASSGNSHSEGTSTLPRENGSHPESRQLSRGPLREDGELVSALSEGGLELGSSLREKRRNILSLEFCLDSGASIHVCGKRSAFDSLEKLSFKDFCTILSKVYSAAMTYQFSC